MASLGCMRRKQEYVNQYKQSRGCAICGYDQYAQGLELHHTGSEHTVTASAKARRGGTNFVLLSWVKLNEELSRCAVLCAVCHRLVHAEILEVSK